MKIVVFGSTGLTGKQLVRQGLGLGHTVTAFARTPEKLGLAHERLRIAQGDVFDFRAVSAALKGQEGVLVALGGKPVGPQPCAPGTLNIVLGMHEHAVRRLIVLSALGVGDSQGEAGRLFTHFVAPTVLRAEMADKTRQERVVQTSKLDWVIARPAYLTNGGKTRTYRAALHLPHPSRISRANVAAFMLAQLTGEAWLRQAVALSD